MKSITIHPGSLVVGAGLLGLVLLLTSAAQRTSASLGHFLSPNPTVEVVGIPDPRDMVMIREGQPFTVPTGKILVVTALGATSNSFVVSLLVDGQNEMEAVANLPYGNSTTVQQLPTGFTVPSGSIVEVTSGQAIFARAWGYLVADAP